MVKIKSHHGAIFEGFCEGFGKDQVYGLFHQHLTYFIFEKDESLKRGKIYSVYTPLVGYVITSEVIAFFED